MSEWSNDLVLEFLEAYKTEPILWNPRHPHYRDKTAMKEAWDRVSGLIGIPVPDIKKKKESLMAMFRTHLKRKKKSMESGSNPADIYKPTWFAYKTMEKFLGRVYDGDNDTKEIPGQSGGEENYSADEATYSVMPISDEGQRDKQSRRRTPHIPEIREANNQMKLAFSLLTNVINEKQTNRDDDECDLFGRLLAKKLKKMNDQERQEIMFEIQTLIMSKRNPRATNNICSSPTSSHISVEHQMEN